MLEQGYANASGASDLGRHQLDAEKEKQEIEDVRSCKYCFH